jgi:probable rRNA maturation factor
VKSDTRHDCSVGITDRQKILRIAKPWLERLVQRALAAEGIEQAEIGILLVDDRRIAKVHDEWLGEPGPTDVITFDLSEPDGAVLRGDIVVSTETAKRMSGEFGWTPRQELAYYVIHGLLHLAGYDDRDPADRRAMRSRERAVMRAVGLPAPPRTRSRRKR